MMTISLLDLLGFTAGTVGIVLFVRLQLHTYAPRMMCGMGFHFYSRWKNLSGSVSGRIKTCFDCGQIKTRPYIKGIHYTRNGAHRVT